MTFDEIAQELVAGCREGRAEENLEKLYAPDAVSVEAMDNGNGRSVQGVAAIRGKHDWWAENFEVLEGTTSDPMPDGAGRFAVIFKMKAKHIPSGEVSDMEEVALYTVTDGKISREEFFYSS